MRSPIPRGSPAMHRKVKKIVDRVWADRVKILTGPDETQDKTDTAEDAGDRYYAASPPVGTQSINEETYEAPLAKVDVLAPLADFSAVVKPNDQFRRYRSSHSPTGLPNMRIYLNVKPEYA